MAALPDLPVLLRSVHACPVCQQGAPCKPGMLSACCMAAQSKHASAACSMQHGFPCVVSARCDFGERHMCATPELQLADTGMSQTLFTLLGFHFPLLVAFLQMLVIAPVCYAVARPQLSWDTVQTVLPLALVNVLNVVCGLVGASPRPSALDAGCKVLASSIPLLLSNLPDAAAAAVAAL